MSDWQPIETAPKDGTWLLLAGGKCEGDEGDEGRIVSGQWAGGTDPRWQFAWYDSGYYGEYSDPSHWMPLPAPPASPSFSPSVPPAGREAA
jgi:hypothetical protein